MLLAATVNRVGLCRNYDSTDVANTSISNASSYNRHPRIINLAVSAPIHPNGLGKFQRAVDRDIWDEHVTPLLFAGLSIL